MMPLLAVDVAVLSVVAIGVALMPSSIEDAKLPRAARRRARDLFMSKLTRRQRRSWSMRRRFVVVAASGRRYTIARYGAYNVSADSTLYCLQVEGAIPVFDKLLAQKLLLEADEQRFLAQANVRAFG
jgi:hypothetical protein